MSDRMEINPRFEKVLAAAGLSKTGDFLAFAGGLTVARSRTTWTVLLEASGGSPGMFIKRYFFPSASDKWKGAFRGTIFGKSKAENEWENLGFISSIGVGAPDRCAWGEQRARGILKGCFIATAQIAGAQRLDAAQSRDPDTGILRRAGSVVEVMHGHGFKDGSMAMRNFLVREEPPGNVEIFKVDCPKGRILERLTPSERAKDIAPLAAGLRLVCGTRGVESFFRGYFKARNREFSLQEQEIMQRTLELASGLEIKERVRLKEAGIGANGDLR